MKNHAVTNLLLGLVALSVVSTSALALIYVRAVQNLNRLQFQSARVTRNRALINSLASDAVEYSRRNPSIDPVLQSVGIKPRSGSAPTQPPVKP